MLAQVLPRFGDASLFELRDVPVPPLAAGCALVEVAATSVNVVDCKIRQHGSSAAPELPAVLGADFSGRIHAMADDVRRLAVGDAVYGLGAGLHGAHGGALAQYLLVDARVLSRKPRSIDFRSAAALPLAAITAWEGLERAGVSEGQRVLVRGGTGGVGHLAVQFARHRGALVTATASTPQRAAVARELGAGTVLDSSEDALRQGARALTAGAGFDVTFDASGRSDLALLAGATRYNGHVVAIAGRGLRELEPLFVRGQSLHLVYVLIPTLHGVGRAEHGAMLATVAALVDAGAARPLVDPRRFTLEEAAEAHRYVESGRPLGKVVIDVADTRAWGADPVFRARADA
jgi:NADPH:quinone reductase